MTELPGVCAGQKSTGIGSKKKNTEADSSRRGDGEMELVERTLRPSKLFHVSVFVREHGDE